MPAASRARTTVVASPEPLRTGALQPAPVVAHVHRSGHEGPERAGRLGVRGAQGDLQPGPAGGRLELGGGALGDHPAVVDDHDPVGQLVGLVEVLGGEQQGHPVGDQARG